MHDRTLIRVENFSKIVKISSLPNEWTKAGCSEGYPGWRMILKGKRFGADWSGRIDLWSVNAKHPMIGDVMRFKEMETIKHLARVPQEPKRWAVGTVPLGVHQVPLDAPCKEGRREYEEEREYIRLETLPGDGQGYEYKAFLIWEEGVQFDRNPDPDILWEALIWGQSRSGKTKNHGRLMVFKS